MDPDEKSIHMHAKSEDLYTNEFVDSVREVAAWVLRVQEMPQLQPICK